MQAADLESASLKRRVDVAIEAARAAGQILTERLGQKIRVEKKQSYNLVTQADLDCEQLICEILQQHFPEDSLFREESDDNGNLNADGVWIIDPLDGTNNFAHGIPQFSISIAYAINGVVQLGVVYDPMRDEMFHGHRPASVEQNVRDSQAMMNEDTIRVSSHESLTDSVVAVGFYYDRGDMMEKTLHSIHDLFKFPIQGIRRFGSAALDICWVAAGRFDGYFEYQLSPWDYAAASLILELAGGKIFDRRGQTFQLDSGSLIASNAHIGKELVEIVRWC